MEIGAIFRKVFGMLGMRKSYPLVGHYMLIAAISLIPGCPMAFDGVTRPNTEDDPVPQRFVTIRFANLSFTEAVHVDFYATNVPLINVPEDLFVPSNLITASVGIAGTGVVEARSSDEIKFPCTVNLTIGTTGGRFIDNESGEARGLGTARWLQEGPLAICDGVVIFAYRSEETGFNTTVAVGN